MNAKQELTDLTMCRAAFAAWVVIYHVDLYLNFSRYLGPAADLIRHGYLGVDGFFFLSGLILARVHPEIAGAAMRESNPKFSPPPLRVMLHFWGKRLVRIYPVHLAAILILAILIIAGALQGWTPRDPSRFSIGALLQNLALVQGWGGASQGTWNYPSWSVSTEWAGYLLFPILWYLAGWSIVYVAIQVMIAAFTVLGLIFVLHGFNLNLAFAAGLFRFFPEFIIGICSTRLVSYCADSAGFRKFGLVAGGVAAVGGAAWGIDLLAVFGLWLVLFAFLMQADAERPPVLGRNPVLNWLGKLSYSFYMSFSIAELLLCQAFRRYGWPPATHAVIFATGMLAITFGLAVFLHIVVENPSRRIADGWLTRPAPAINPA